MWLGQKYQGKEKWQTLFLDTSRVLFLGRILITIFASLEFDEFHGKRFAEESLRLYEHGIE